MDRRSPGMLPNKIALLRGQSAYYDHNYLAGGT